ncbi:hypothetical protein [Vampirovibrio sp.]|uniref:hypothetical protein n=1 Tax=Vampirovibrio sp. TaxID=2717857 RepID=UPI003593BA41
MRTFQFFDNSGGMNLKANDLTLKDGEAEEIINLHATTQGSWSSDNAGYVQLNTTPLAGGQPITSLYDYKNLTGQSFLMAVAHDSLFTFNVITGEATLIYDELTPNRPMNFVTFQGLLIGCNGTDNPIKWDGINPVELLENWPPDVSSISPGNPSIAENYSNRVVFSGDANNPSLIYISELENAENFDPDAWSDSPGAIQISPGDGEKITALKTLFLPLLNEEVLVIFKERSTYVLSGVDIDTFAVQKVSDEFGAVNQRSLVLIGNELMFLSPEGVTSLSTATAQGNITTNFLSSRIQTQITNLNRSQLTSSFAVHLRNRQEVWWFVAEGIATQNQTVLVYNYGINRAWSKRQGIVGNCGAVLDGKLYTGNYEGMVQQQLKGNSYNGQPIPWLYRSGFHDLGNPRLRKRVKDIQLFLKQISRVDVTVNMYWNLRRGSQNRESRTCTVIPDSASITYGEASYGQDYYNQAGTSSFTVIPAGSGQYFQMELKGSEINSPVDIKGWTITVINGGMR